MPTDVYDRTISRTPLDITNEFNDFDDHSKNIYVHSEQSSSSGIIKIGHNSKIFSTVNSTSVVYSYIESVWILLHFTYFYFQKIVSNPDEVTDINDRKFSRSPIEIPNELDNSNDYSNDIFEPCTSNSVYSDQSTSSGITTSGSGHDSTFTSSASTDERRGSRRPDNYQNLIPDVSEIAHLPEIVRRTVLRRARNKISSRKSRLKNKEHNMAIEREERELINHNTKLNLELQNIRRAENKLRLACKRISILIRTLNQ